MQVTLIWKYKIYVHQNILAMIQYMPLFNVLYQPSLHRISIQHNFYIYYIQTESIYGYERKNFKNCFSFQDLNRESCQSALAASVKYVKRSNVNSNNCIQPEIQIQLKLSRNDLLLVKFIHQMQRTTTFQIAIIDYILLFSHASTMYFVIYVQLGGVMKSFREFLGPSIEASRICKLDNENECIKKNGKRRASADTGIIRRSKKLKFSSTAMCSPYTVKGPICQAKA